MVQRRKQNLQVPDEEDLSANVVGNVKENVDCLNGSDIPFLFRLIMSMETQMIILMTI